MSRPRRALLVGWDGATWDVLDPLLAAGRLPHLAEVLRTGFRTTLRSTVPAVTPAAWTAIATGCGPGTTGVLGFRHLDLRRPGGYSPQLAGSADLRGRTLFEYAAQQGIGVASLAFPMTWPPFPIEDGVLLSGWPRPETPRAPVLPASLQERFGPWAPGPQRAADPELTGDGQRDPVRAARERDGRTHRAALQVLSERADALVAVVYQGTDHVAHRFWGTSALDDYVVQADAWLGELLAAAGPDTAVVLASDHGFGPAPTRTVHLGRALRDAGLLHLSGGPRGQAVRSVRDGVSTGVRKRLRDRMPGAVRRWAWERSQGLDRLDPRTRVVRVPLYGAWDGLVVQVRGRQRGGSVDPADWARVREQARDLVFGLRDSTGPLVTACWRREELWVGPRVADLPDLVVELREDCVGGGLLDAGPVVTPRAAPPGEGSHRRAGVVAGGGPGLGRGGVAPMEPQDVLPTLLATLGLAVPEAVQGRARADVLTAPPPAPESGRIRAPGASSADGGRRAIEASLAELGYL